MLQEAISPYQLIIALRKLKPEATACTIPGPKPINRCKVVRR